MDNSRAKFADRKLWLDLARTARVECSTALEAALALKALVKADCFKGSDGELTLSSVELAAVMDLLWKALYLSGSSSSHKNPTTGVTSPTCHHTVVFCFHAVAYFGEFLTGRKRCFDGTIAHSATTPSPTDATSPSEAVASVGEGAMAPPRHNFGRKSGRRGSSSSEEAGDGPPPSGAASDDVTWSLVPTSRISGSSAHTLLQKLCHIAHTQIRKHEFVRQNFRQALELASHVSFSADLGGPPCRVLLVQLLSKIHEELLQNPERFSAGLGPSDVFFVVNTYGRAASVFARPASASPSLSSGNSSSTGTTRSTTGDTTAKRVELLRAAYVQGLMAWLPLVQTNLVRMNVNQLAGIANSYGKISSFLDLSQLLAKATSAESRDAACWRERAARRTIELFTQLGAQLCGLFGSSAGPHSKLPPGALKTLASATNTLSVSNLERNRLRNIILVSSAFAAVGVRHERWFDDVVAVEIPELLPQTSARQLSMLLHAFVKLKIKNPMLLQLVRGQIQSRVEGLSDLHALSLMLQAVTKSEAGAGGPLSGAGGGGGPDGGLLQTLAARGKTLLEEAESSCSPHSLAVLAYCLFQSRYFGDHEHDFGGEGRCVAEPLWSILGQRCSKDVQQFSPAELANLAMAFGSAPAGGKAFFDALIARVGSSSRSMERCDFASAAKILQGLAQNYKLRQTESGGGGEAIPLTCAQTLVQFLMAGLATEDRRRHVSVSVPALVSALQTLGILHMSDDLLQMLSQRGRPRKGGR